MEIRANARKNQVNSNRLIRKYFNSGYFITILHKNSRKLSTIPPPPPREESAPDVYGRVLENVLVKSCDMAYSHKSKFKVVLVVIK